MSRQTFKKLVSMTICIMLLFSIVACTQEGTSDVDKTSKKETAKSNGKEDNDTSEGEADKESDDMEENTLPITEEDITFTLYMGMDTGARQVYSSYAEHPVFKEVEKQTGLKFEFMHPPEGDDGTFFNTTIASGILPDLFMGTHFESYPGGPDGAMEDGVLIDHTDLVKQYAPNYWKLINSFDEDMQKRIRSDKGTIIRFGTMFNPPFIEGITHYGMILRNDWLKKYDLEMPETYDEFENYLKTLKDNGIQYPLGMPKPQDWGHNYFSAGFNVTHNGFYLKDGEVTYSRTQPEFKEYMGLMADWYKKGYFSPDFVNKNGSDAQKDFRAGKTGVAVCGGWELVTNNHIGQIEDPDFDTMGVPFLRKNRGDKLTFINRQLSPESRAWFMSADCEHPVEAVKFVDYLHMPETMKMTAWGVNTEEYTIWDEKDGKRVFTEFMTDNPDFDFATARDRYTAKPLQVMWDEEMEKQQYDLPVVKESWANWQRNSDLSSLLPYWLIFTSEESEERASIMSQIDTYTDEMMLKYITGEESLDNFDKFAEKVEEMDIDRVIEIYEAAYKRYLER